jgi:ATP-dependent exoDNAse (exonuclease V) alpha subunit
MTFVPSPDQEKAANEFLNFLYSPTAHEMTLSGSAGTGKTTLMRHLLHLVRTQKEVIKLLTKSNNSALSVHLTSTTNKAANVLSEATMEQSGTIHSLLGLRPMRDYGTGKEYYTRSRDSQVVSNHLIVIDEASMINKDLLQLIRDNTMDCKVLYVMDRFQLAPVGENTCPAYSQVSLKSELTQIQRQVAGSPIIDLATDFRNAVMGQSFPKIENRGAEVVHVDGATFKSMVDDAYQQPHNANDLRIVAWTNNRVRDYNKYVRSLFTPFSTYQVGERLLANSTIVGSGGEFLMRTDQIGTVTSVSAVETIRGIEGYWISIDGKPEMFLPLDFTQVTTLLKHLRKHKNWSDFYNVQDFFVDLRPIHSNSVHKSQGSTYKNVFIDVSDIGRNTKLHEIARLMYVATSRASEKVIMTGDLPRRVYK